MTVDLTVATPVRSASSPPEARGIARDGVRLLVAEPDAIHHVRLRDLPDLLKPGDLLVVNTSKTLAAAVEARRHRRPATVHFSTALPDGSWAVELRPGRRAGGPLSDAVPGEVVHLPRGSLRLLRPYPVATVPPDATRLWQAAVRVRGTVESYLARHGRPIAYSYVPADWPLSSYQTVFARQPGSAEMPSAARPFTADVVSALVARGVALAPVVLHTGVSSLEAGEPPLPERFEVPEATSRLVTATRRGGGRVVAVGTTVTRALETQVGADGDVHAGAGWTDLVLSADRPARVVRGLVTGWHEPGSSHLDLLTAVAGPGLVARAYRAAVAEGYLWHEFGDSALLLP